MKTELSSKKDTIRTLQLTKSCLENELSLSQNSLRDHLDNDSSSNLQRHLELEAQVYELYEKEKDYKNRIYQAEMASAKLLRRAQTSESKLYAICKYMTGSPQFI